MTPSATNRKPDQSRAREALVGDDLVLVPASSGASTLYAVDGDRVYELGTFTTLAEAWAAIDRLDEVP
jgi:hypothetical protein